MKSRPTPTAAIVAVLAILLVACEGITHVNLSASSYSIARYESWAPLRLLEVKNPSDRLLTQVVITAECREQPFKNLRSKFESAPLTLEPMSTLPEASLRLVDGYPTFTSGPVSCKFDAYNRAWPSEVEVAIHVQR